MYIYDSYRPVINPTFPVIVICLFRITVNGQTFSFSNKFDDFYCLQKIACQINLIDLKLGHLM